MSKLTEPIAADDGRMTNKNQSADVTVTAFEILQAVTGELPCHASPNWKRVRQEESHAKEAPCRYSPEPLGKGSRAGRPERNISRRREELRSPEQPPRPVGNTPNYPRNPESPMNRARLTCRFGRCGEWDRVPEAYARMRGGRVEQVLRGPDPTPRNGRNDRSDAPRFIGLSGFLDNWECFQRALAVVLAISVLLFAGRCFARAFPP